MQLTDPRYWDGRYRGVASGAARPEPEWLAPMLPHLLPYAGQRLLELGCVPGHASRAILDRVPFRPEGVDFAGAGDLYLAERNPTTWLAASVSWSTSPTSRRSSIIMTGC